MSVFSRFALRSLAKNRSRTIVSIFGIALSCALIAAVLTTVASMSHVLEARTAADEGAWQIEAAGLTRQGYDWLAADDRLDRTADVIELGAVALGDENAPDYGSYCFVKTWPQNPEDERIIGSPEIESGHMPEHPGEVALPSFFDGVELAPCGIVSNGTIELGAKISVELGERTIVNSDGKSYAGTSGYANHYAEEENITQAFEPTGTLDGLTVVGFYRAFGYSSTMALRNSSLFVFPDTMSAHSALADSSDSTCVYTLATVRNAADARKVADDLEARGYVIDGAQTHSSLLRWQGLTQDSVVWNTLYQIAAVLALVIMAAGISLVYNAFAISVSERTRQFGLLASLGASKRQLRRTVLTEALILSAVSIPIGLALGLIGCHVVFQLTGSGLVSMFGLESPSSTIPVVVNPRALAVSAALALITVLMSAWIPARRAGRVSAVDAIRQERDIRVARRRRLTPHKAALKMPTDHAPGLAGRLFGVPGFVAHRNLSRATSKGRVTVGALAVSVSLLIISGSIAGVLDYASGTAVDTAGDVDLSVYVDATSAESAEGSLVRANGEVDMAGFQTALDGLFDDARQRLDDADALGYYTRYITDAIVPASMLSDSASSFLGDTLADGSWAGPVYVNLVDDETWKDYIERLGLPQEDFRDPAHPRAVMLNKYDMGAGDTGYGSYSPMAQAGDVETVTYEAVEGMYASGIFSEDDGQPYVWYTAPDGTERHLSLEEGLASHSVLAVGAISDQAPLSITTHTTTPQLILPASALAAVENLGFGDARIDISTEGSAKGASDAQGAFDAVAADHPELDCVYRNFAQEKMQARMMNETIGAFIYCFTAITGLIAVANAFNTLSTSLVLRKREFAVLKSIGMGDAAFRRMIAYECASYALRGLAIGFALALAIHAVLYRSMRESFQTFAFELPWAQMGIAAAITLAVILISVAYALRICRTKSVVEALRQDAI